MNPNPVTETCIPAGSSKCAAPISELDKVFSNVLIIALGLAGVALFIMLIIGGIKWITAGGDPKAVESAKGTVTYAIVGVIFLALAYIILVFIKTFTNVDVTQFHIVR